ncbi:hypothetical protein BKA58DRAFT_449214 [Alternaria rosae]|uniref:uncharacterized protein n=1 Tax=Alternaria rosae TaxID=1187941 RepID=UPI001E8D27F8|nr:uncharacterized protein BKA58DRAFT_449214 [Alternaria rosae]KAH6858878.1 hypothetical protein BKA58DRAFT_449214 [Alternaria rosae]
MAFNNTYGSARDPRLSRQPSNVDMPDEVSAIPTPNRQSVPMQPQDLAAPPLIDGNLALMRRVPELIATKSLGDLTVSYSKRLEEKNAVLSENAAIEQRQMLMEKDTARSAREISDMTMKIQEMEAQIQAYEDENTELQCRVTTLETEAHRLQCHIYNLEFEKEQDRPSDATDGNTGVGRRDSTQRPMMNVNANSPHQGSDRERESRYSEAVYVEHRRRSSGFYERGGHQRGARRERDRDRNARNRSSTNDCFVPDLYPPTGPRAERR